MSSSSDDDEQGVPLSPRVVTPLGSVPAGVETRERWQTWVVAATMPDSMQIAPAAGAWVTPSTIAQTATAVPMTMRTTPVVTAQATTAVPETMRATLVVAMEVPSSSATG